MKANPSAASKPAGNPAPSGKPGNGQSDSPHPPLRRKWLLALSSVLLVVWLVFLAYMAWKY